MHCSVQAARTSRMRFALHFHPSRSLRNLKTGFPAKTNPGRLDVPVSSQDIASTSNGSGLHPLPPGDDEVGSSTADCANELSFNEIYEASSGTKEMVDAAAQSSECRQTEDTREIDAKRELNNIIELRNKAQAVLCVDDVASWAAKVEATRSIQAEELLDGIPAAAAAAKAWRQAFSTFCRLPPRNSGEVTDEVNQLLSGFVTHGVDLACLIDMVQLQLRTIGTDAASRTLSQEATALHCLLDHLNIPDSCQRLRDLLKELKISAQTCSKYDKGDFEVPITQAANAERTEDSPGVSSGREDVFAHLRDSRYEVQEGEMIDLAMEEEDDAMRFINPLLKGGLTTDIGQEQAPTALPHLGIDDINITADDIRTPGETSTKPASENKGPPASENKSPTTPSSTKRDVNKRLKDHFRHGKSANRTPATSGPPAAKKRAGTRADEYKSGADVVSSQAAPEGADVERVFVKNKASLRLDRAAILRKIKEGKGDLGETVANAGKKNRVQNPQALVLPNEFKPRKGEHEKWTYQLLAESKAVVSMTADLISESRMLLAAHLVNEGRPLNIEWAIVIDNSGSMVRVADECIQTVVILIETLRRLECRFSIATLGDAYRTRILKALDGPFSVSVGEQILAGLTYDESSHIATGVAAVANHLFPVSRGNAEPHERRIMVLITDGLSEELSKENFSDLRQTHDTELAVLHTQYGEGGKHKAHYEDMLRAITITNRLYFPVSIAAGAPESHGQSENTVLPAVLLKMVILVLRHIVDPNYHHASNQAIDSSADAERLVDNVRFPSIVELRKELAHGTYPLRVARTDIRAALKEGAATRPLNMYGSSSPEATIAMAEKLQDLLDTRGSARHNRDSSAENMVFQVRKN